MNPEEVNPFLQALYSMLGEMASQGYGPVAMAFRRVDATFINVSTMHLALPVESQKKIAVVVETDAEPFVYSIYWPVNATLGKVESELLKKGTITAETRIVAGNIPDAVSVVKSIVLTELLNQKSDG